MAQEVGIDPDGPEMTLKIAGAPRRVVFADAKLRLCPPEVVPPTGGTCGATNGLEWEATVGFIRDWADPPWAMVLGQTGFLDRFTVVLSRLSQALAVEDCDHFDEMYGPLIQREHDSG